jgi:hypothetical protein
MCGRTVLRRALLLVTLAAPWATAPALAQKPKPVASAKASATGDVPPPTTPPPATPATSEKGVADTKEKAGVIKTEEGKEGVKTYQFGAVEVEGRLRSPQLIYFLRRVRAEFVAGELGHRSFLRELDATQRQPSFR